jgi:hypothetical protein
MKVLPFLVAAGIAAVVCPAVADSTLSVGWASPSIVVYVVPGLPQQQQAEILIRAQRDEDRIVSLIPSAELRPYVSELASTVVDVPSDLDQSATITFTASLPQNTPSGKTVAGSIDVLLTDKSRSVLEKWSLPVSIRAIDDYAMPKHLLTTLDLRAASTGAEEEDCSNGLDDDGDGEADCQDAKCASEPFCHGGSCTGFGRVDQSQLSKVGRGRRGQGQCVSGGALQILAFMPQGQEFIPSEPSVAAIELLLEAFNPPYADNLYVRIREGSIAGAILGTSSIETVYHPLAFDTFWQRFEFPTPVSVLPGEKYVYEVIATDASFALHYVQTATFNSDGTFSYGRCDYPGGVMITGGDPYPVLDQNFVTCAPK